MMIASVFRACAIAFIAFVSFLPQKTFAAGMDQVEKVLPLLGHRNWIVVADSAYPLQSNPGITTLKVDDSQASVVKKVLDMLGKQKHVRPMIYTDTELDHVSEKNAPGIENYRKQLKELWGGRKVASLPHEDIISKLYKAGSIFNVIIIKTNGRLPYTSVFFELDCAYWSEQGEKDLRASMKQTPLNDVFL